MERYRSRWRVVQTVMDGGTLSSAHEINELRSQMSRITSLQAPVVPLHMKNPAYVITRFGMPHPHASASARRQRMRAKSDLPLRDGYIGYARNNRRVVTRNSFAGCTEADQRLTTNYPCSDRAAGKSPYSFPEAIPIRRILDLYVVSCLKRRMATRGTLRPMTR